MKCEQWLPLIEEYLDNELDREQSRKVAAHIALCASCHSACEALRRELDFYANYHRDIQVSPDLWTGVSSRIRFEKATERKSVTSRFYQWFAAATAAPRLSPALAALLVILAVTATVVTMRYLNRTNGNQPRLAVGPAQSSSAQSEPSAAPGTGIPAAPSEEPGKQGMHSKELVQKNAIARVVRQPAKADRPVVDIAPSPEKVVKEAEEKQLAAIAVLDKEIQKRRSDLDPALVAKFQVALTAVDRTIAQTRKAVHDHPGDPVAAQYMLAAYAEKIEVLKEIAGQ